MTDAILKLEELQPKSWYLLQEGELSQPMSESQVSKLILDGQLSDDVRIKQADSDFVPVSEVRALFIALRDQGWYVRNAGSSFGPFVGDKLIALVATGFFKPASISVRQGLSGDWIPFDAAKRNFERQSREIKQRLAKQKKGTQVAIGIGLYGDEDAPDRGATISELPGTRWNLDPERIPQTALEVKANKKGIQTLAIGDADDNELGVIVAHDRKRRGPAKRVCTSCALEHHEKTMLCPACTTKKKKQEAELAKHQKRVQDANAGHSENLVAKVILLFIAFSASGFFLSKWLVTSVVWREFFVRDQQTIGWVHFGLGSLLLLAGGITILLDQDRSAVRKLIVIATLSLLLVGGSRLAIDYGRLGNIRQQMQLQNDAWLELMADGGYGEQSP